MTHVQVTHVLVTHMQGADSKSELLIVRQPVMAYEPTSNTASTHAVLIVTQAVVAYSATREALVTYSATTWPTAPHIHRALSKIGSSGMCSRICRVSLVAYGGA